MGGEATMETAESTVRMNTSLANVCSMLFASDMSSRHWYKTMNDCMNVMITVTKSRAKVTNPLSRNFVYSPALAMET